jgi:hypothetical protein
LLNGLATLPRLSGFEVILHWPTPTVGLFALNATVPQAFNISGPAAAGVGDLSKVISTSSVLGVQAPFEIVQRSVYVFPRVPVNPEAGLVASENEPPVPLTMVHAPLPTIGLLAANVPEVPQKELSTPAFAVVGVSLFDKTTSSVLVQAPLVMDQRRVTDCPRVNPVTPELFAAGVVMVAPFAEPTTVHVPVPEVGELPANVKDPL